MRQTGNKVEKIVSSNSTIVDKDINQLYCFGKYNWTVLACLDSGCKDAGATPLNWQFTFASSGPETKKGATPLAVCGLSSDNPDTSWDEREACQLKHLLILVEQLINFIIFKLALFILPILGLITGVIFYLSLGGMETLGMVKKMWKAVGIGYALLLFAWIIVGVLMTIAGYHGVWWKI